MQDLSTAINFSQTVISLAISTGNAKMQSRGLYDLAWHNWFLGNYSAAKMYAHESERVARISANLLREAMALHFEAICLCTLGDYQQVVPLHNRARDLVALCGMSGGRLDRSIMNDQAEVYKLKSEYPEAWSILSGLLEVASIEQDPYQHAFALLNISEIEVSIGTPEKDVERNIQTAMNIFNSRGLDMEVTMCETILSDLYLREGNLQTAEILLEKCIKSWRIQPDIVSYCLERLGNVSRWNVHHASSWTTVYFVHSLKFKEKLGIYKALQFLGDIFLADDDTETAVSLFAIALEGFTRMDVHRSRAECMLQLGDISRKHGNLLEAVELWEAAKPLFKQSSQAKQVEHIDGRLASIEANVLVQHQKNLARLAELNAPSKAVEDLEDDLSDIEDLQKLDLDEGKELNPVAL
jgi:tetratricopeptide (TPR) repeat protein